MLSDPRFHARAVVNRQVHAIQQNARANNAPFGFNGGALGKLVPLSDIGQLSIKPRKPRKPRVARPRNKTDYKLRGTNASRIRDATTNIRSTMPQRKFIRARLVAEFLRHGLEGVPTEIYQIVESIINELQTIQNQMISRPLPDPDFATEYFPRRPRAPRARKAPVITIEQLQQQVGDSINRATVRAKARGRPKMTDEQKQKMQDGRDEARRARAEVVRLRKKRKDMNARAIRYNQGLEE